MSDRPVRSRAFGLPLALSLAALAATLPTALLACGGDDSSLLGAPKGSSPGDDAGSSRDSTVPTSDAQTPNVDAADTAPFPLNPYDATDIPDGGLRVTPGVVACGPMTCNAFGGNQCCSGGDDEAGVCLTASLPCAPGASSFECNSSADCILGNVCCGTVSPVDDGGFVIVTRCKTSCAEPLPRFCRTNGECVRDSGVRDAGEGGASASDGGGDEGGADDAGGGAGGCVVQTCSDGMTYEICGVFRETEDSGATFSCTPQ